VKQQVIQVWHIWLNIIGHRTAACRAVLTAGDVTHCTIHQDPCYEIHHIYKHIANDAKYVLTQRYAIFLNCRPLRHGLFCKMIPRPFKHNINTVNILILHVSKGSTWHLEEGQDPQGVCGPQDVTTVFKDASDLIEVFYLLLK
jgi:hypothetical protein